MNTESISLPQNDYIPSNEPAFLSSSLGSSRHSRRGSSNQSVQHIPQQRPPFFDCLGSFGLFDPISVLIRDYVAPPQLGIIHKSAIQRNSHSWSYQKHHNHQVHAANKTVFEKYIFYFFGNVKLQSMHISDQEGIKSIFYPPLDKRVSCGLLVDIFVPPPCFSDAQKKPPILISKVRKFILRTCKFFKDFPNSSNWELMHFTATPPSDWNDIEGTIMIVFNSATRYTGGFKKSRPNGEGILFHKDISYDGTWTGGTNRGCTGTFTTANGSSYQGTFSLQHLFTPQGNGIFSIPNEGKYVGEWKEGKRHGIGVANFLIDGVFETHEGTWEDDQLCSGTRILKGLTTYKGKFRNFLLEGIGNQKDSDGGEYEGNWSNGKRHGQGIQIYSEQSIYRGEWENDQRHGQGFLTFQDGATYNGRWENDLRHGQGRFTSLNETYIGEWFEDKKHGNGINTNSDGTEYAGEWKNGLKNSSGIEKCSDGSVYEGYWRDDLRHGEGVERYLDGSMYNGTWKNGLRHGDGIHTFPDTRQEDREYKNGVLQELADDFFVIE